MRISAQSGFTVVESLMAMVVAGSIAIAMVFALGKARQYAHEAHVREVALRIANGLLIEAEQDNPLELTHEGPAGQDGLIWQRNIAAVEDSDALYRISVSVPWRAGLRTGNIERVVYRWAES